MVWYTYNPGTGLHSKYKASLGYTVWSWKKERKKERGVRPNIGEEKRLSAAGGLMFL